MMTNGRITSVASVVKEKTQDGSYTNALKTILCHNSECNELSFLRFHNKFTVTKELVLSRTTHNKVCFMFHRLFFMTHLLRQTSAGETYVSETLAILWKSVCLWQCTELLTFGVKFSMVPFRVRADATLRFDWAATSNIREMSKHSVNGFPFVWCTFVKSRGTETYTVFYI